MRDYNLHHVFTYNDRDRAFWAEHLEDWVPQRLVDAHVHISDARFRLETPSAAARRSFWVAEVAEPQTAPSLARCYRVIYPGREVAMICFGCPDLSYDIAAQNAYTARVCAARGWHGLAVNLPSWSAQDVERALARPGIIGLKPYYALLGRAATTRDTHIDASIFDYLPHHQLEVVNDRGGWVTLHVPRAERLGHPDNIREVRELRRRYPDIVLVIAHLGRCYTEPHAREALPQLADDPGLYWDNCAVLNPTVHRLALQLIGPDRILYGTDNPVFYLRGRRQYQGRQYLNRTNYPFFFNRQREVPAIEADYTLYLYEDLKALKDVSAELGLTRAQIEAVFHGNAERLIERVMARRR